MLSIVRGESVSPRNPVPISRRDTRLVEASVCRPRIQRECSQPRAPAPARPEPLPSGREARDLSLRKYAFSWDSSFIRSADLFVFFAPGAPESVMRCAHFRALLLEAQCTRDELEGVF